VSWHLLAQVNFAYPLGYKLLHLENHIAEYAPLNRYKSGFEQTTEEEHWRLFGDITDGIQHHGNNLDKIYYQTTDGQKTQLLHEAELIHLHDVAHLIDTFYQVGIVCMILWAALLAVAYRQKIPVPSIKKILLGFLSGIVVLSLLVIAIGAKDVFYWFHVKIFPDNHQWFFYYQDSLMTTLMKAPDIFAFIALLLLCVWVLLWCGSLWLMATYFSRTASTQAAVTTQAPNTSPKSKPSKKSTRSKKSSKP